jgi:hypothetical protein
MVSEVLDISGSEWRGEDRRFFGGLRLAAMNHGPCGCLSPLGLSLCQSSLRKNCVLVSLCSGSLAAHLWGNGRLEHIWCYPNCIAFLGDKLSSLYLSRPCAVCLTPPLTPWGDLFSYCRSQKVELPPHNDTHSLLPGVIGYLRAAIVETRRKLEVTRPSNKV